MNSFRFIERGIAAEIERQAEILDAGGRIEQETLHFDPRSGALTPLRSKEYSHDYRYFPEPDLVPLVPTEEMIAAARESLPELPAERRARYLDLTLPEAMATQLANDVELGDYFETVLASVTDVPAARVAGWVTGELAGAAESRGIGGIQTQTRASGERHRDGRKAARSTTPEGGWSSAALVSEDVDPGSGGRRGRPGAERGLR